MGSRQQFFPLTISKHFITNCAHHFIVISIVFSDNYNLWQAIQYFTRTAIYLLSNIIFANNDMFSYEIEVISIIVDMLHDLSPTKSRIPDNLDGLVESIVELAMIQYESNYNHMGVQLFQ